MDDFTFPTTTAVAVEAADPLCVHLHRRLPFPHFAASPLWFPAAADPSPPAAGAAAVATSVVSSPGSVDGDGVMAGGEATTTSDSGKGRAAEEGERELVCGPGAGGVDEEKMDLLWENFNEELEEQRRAGSCSKTAVDTAGAGAGSLEATSDSESETGAGRAHGCAPVLRASSRAGGTGHYRRTSWVLLMRIFRRLFVVEKTIAAARQQARAR